MRRSMTAKNAILGPKSKPAHGTWEKMSVASISRASSAGLRSPGRCSARRDLSFFVRRMKCSSAVFWQSAPAARASSSVASSCIVYRSPPPMSAQISYAHGTVLAGALPARRGAPMQ